MYSEIQHKFYSNKNNPNTFPDPGGPNVIMFALAMSSYIGLYKYISPEKSSDWKN